MPYIVASSCIPLLHYVLICLIARPKAYSQIRNIILLSFTLTATITFGVIRYFVISLISIVPLLILALLREDINTRAQVLDNKIHYRGILLTLVLLMVFAGLNSYWLLPSVYMSKYVVLTPPYIVTIETLEMFSRSYTLLHIFTLDAIWWPYLDVKLPSLFYALELVVFGALIAIPILLINVFNSPLSRFILLSSVMNLLMGIVMRQGMSGFSTAIYLLLLALIPPSYHWIFRVPEHFASLVIAAYSELFVFSILSLYFAPTIPCKNIVVKSSKA